MPEAAAGETDLALAVRVTQGAAALALRHFHLKSEWWDKAPGNPVGIADLECDAYLARELLGARPDDGWLSEETADTDVRLGKRRVWVVDPIDGTRDFIRGRSGWAVSAALVEDGVSVLACLAAPARRQLFVAGLGDGAMLNGVPLAVSGRTALAGVRLPIDPPTLTAPFWPEPWDAVAIEKPNSIALRMAHVAAGEADGFIEGRTVHEWDVAAAALIVTEAGGQVGDRFARPLAFNQPAPLVHGLVAATPALHEALRRQLDGGLRALAAVRSKRTV